MKTITILILVFCFILSGCTGKNVFDSEDKIIKPVLNPSPTKECTDYDHLSCPKSCTVCVEHPWDSSTKCMEEKDCGNIMDEVSPVKQCTDYNRESCPTDCVVCPPCEICSSISCQTEEFCKNIGFDKEWAERVLPKK